jgi:hypothetical protein
VQQGLHPYPWRAWIGKNGVFDQREVSYLAAGKNIQLRKKQGKNSNCSKLIKKGVGGNKNKNAPNECWRRF